MVAVTARAATTGVVAALGVRANVTGDCPLSHLDHYTLSVCLTDNIIYTANFIGFYPNALCNFDQGYEQTTFHKLTGWGNWLRTNQQQLWGNPTSDGGGPLK